jgi:SNF2 family DNA or RNA helicase
MQRFPLNIDEVAHTVFEEDRQAAIAHAQRRETNIHLEPVTPPGNFLATLYPYQAEGVAFLLANERALLADGLGLGKTYTSLGAVAAVGAQSTLVVVQAHLQHQWKRMIGMLFDAPTQYQLRLDAMVDEAAERSKHLVHICRGLKPYDLPDAPFLIIHYGLLRGWKEVLMERPFDVVIFDEVQEVRRTGTQKYSAASIASGLAKNVWGLSGTPVYNYGGEIWAVMNVIDHQCLSTKDAFTREWCDGYLSDKVTKPNVLGDYMRREGMMIRRRSEDVQAQLPPVRRVVHHVDHDEAKYAKLMREAMTLVDEYTNVVEFTKRGQVGRQIERLTREATGIAKAPYVAEFVRLLIEGGEVPLVFAWHHAVHDILYERIRARTINDIGRITGRQSTKEKERALYMFQRGMLSSLIISLRSGAGLDGLQERATVIVFAELDWTPPVHSQCEGRIARLGVNDQLSSVLSYYCVTDVGMDEIMQDALGLKVQQITGIMGDRVETEEDKALAQQVAEQRMAKLVARLKAERKRNA